MDGKPRYHGEFGLLVNGSHSSHRGAVGTADHGRDLVLFNKLGCHRHSFFCISSVIVDHELYRATVDAASVVDLPDSKLYRLPDTEPVGSGEPGERRMQPDLDGICTDNGHGQRTHDQTSECDQEPPEWISHRWAPPNLPCSRSAFAMMQTHCLDERQDTSRS